MRSLLLSAALGVALAGSVRAGDFKLPDENPVASFTIPGSWKPAEYEDGVEAVRRPGISLSLNSVKLLTLRRACSNVKP
jgi:hypothetical protein